MLAESLSTLRPKHSNSVADDLPARSMASVYGGRRREAPDRLVVRNNPRC